MDNLTLELKNRINSTLEKYFEPVIVNRIDKLSDFFSSVIDLREAFPDFDPGTVLVKLESAEKICSSINELVDRQFQRTEDLDVTTLFPGLIDGLDNIVSILDPITVIEQSEDRFKQLPGDSRKILFIKKIKRIFFKTHLFSRKLKYVILFKSDKNQSKPKYWDQKVPQRNVGYYLLRDELIVKLSELYEEVSKQLSRNAVDFWNFDTKYDVDFMTNFENFSDSGNSDKSTFNPELIIQELNLLKEEIKERSSKIIDKSLAEFSDNCDRAGTLELSRSQFSDKKLNRHFKAVKSAFDTLIREWDNTFYALGEDWELDYDIVSARYKVSESFFKFEKSLDIKNRIQIYPQFKEISNSLNSILDKLNQPAGNIDEIIRLIAYSKDSLQKNLLSSYLPNLINTISDLKLVKMLDETTSEIKGKVISINKKRAFVKTSNYDSGIRTSDIDEIYPREFIMFNALPLFTESLEKIKSESIGDLKNVKAGLIDLGNMADFGLESAITAASSENLNTVDVRDIALEGINISINKREELQKTFEEICKNVTAELKTAILTFSNEMNSFTESSKIVEIRIQLAKAKTKVIAKQTKDKIVSVVSKAIPIIFQKTKEYFQTATKFYWEKRKQFGLSQHKEPISSEISEFLTRSNIAVEKLPYIYRRLFQISPLENDRLYIQRELEEKQIENAYNSWLKGVYAPVILSSEKGGGITSLINILLQKLGSKYPVKRIEVKPNAYDTKQFFDLFSQLFVPEKINSFDELVNVLNREEYKHVIVVENLQHLYLRAVNGFNSLKILIDVISKTSKNIFWIVSSTQYANEFLNKAMRLNDSFGFHISLKPLKNSQITKLIRKRNSISGYKLKYIPSSESPRNKDFEKLPYDQKQNILEKEFFSSLNKFAQSNLSLALLFWLRSIQEIQERKVVINADFEIASNLLDSLSQEKVFIIQSLLLHDGLKLSDLAMTINFSLSETSNLSQILFDDGVLIKNEDVYFINPLLYRQCVTLLKSKNLLL